MQRAITATVSLGQRAKKGYLGESTLLTQKEREKLVDASLARPSETLLERGSSSLWAETHTSTRVQTVVET